VLILLSSGRSALLATIRSAASRSPRRLDANGDGPGAGRLDPAQSSQPDPDSARRCWIWPPAAPWGPCCTNREQWRALPEGFWPDRLLEGSPAPIEGPRPGPRLCEPLDLTSSSAADVVQWQRWQRDHAASDQRAHRALRGQLRVLFSPAWPGRWLAELMAQEGQPWLIGSSRQ